MYQNYVQIAPSSDEWPELFDEMGVMLGRDYNWSNEVANLKMAVMMVVGDSDVLRPLCAVEFYELLGGQRDAGWDGAGMVISRLAILPGLTHYNIVSFPALAALANNFFAAPSVSAV